MPIFTIKSAGAPSTCMATATATAAKCLTGREMDGPDITMEEYIQLEAEKAHRRGQEFNWEPGSYRLSNRIILSPPFIITTFAARDETKELPLVPENPVIF
ncbi:hypothetical protein Tco_1419302 [Tanacetum coccineum]